MTSILHPYIAYKPSGVRWLGNVPRHWEIRRVRTVATVLNGATPSTDVPAYWDGEILWLTPEDLGKLSSKYVRSSARSISSEGYQSCGTVLAPTGAVAISTRAPIGHLGILTSDGCVNQGCRLLVPRFDVESEYLHYALSASQKELAALGQGSTFTELSRTHLANFQLPLPPLDEQRAIVRYLDYVDRHIRRYVSAKRKLIALLEEEKQVIVNQAVTRGLDPNVRLKPSGVEWLGDVPEHWDVRRLRTVAEMRVSNVDKHSRENELPVRLCNYVDVYKNDRITQDIPFMNTTASWDEIERFRLEQGDVLITKDSETWDDIGVPALVTEPADDLLSGYHLALLRPSKEMMGPFLARTLQAKAVAYQFHVRANGVTRYGLAHVGIKSVCIPLPSLAEQGAIVEYLDDATAGVDTTTARARRQIELVQEYRTRLVADVVTGKVDVREAASRLPEEGEEEPMDEDGPSADDIERPDNDLGVGSGEE